VTVCQACPEEENGLTTATSTSLSGHAGIVFQISLAPTPPKRMVAYYETETDRPPAHLLPAIVNALAVSFDDLMGAGHLPSEPVEVDVRVWRRFQRLQSLPPGEKKTVLNLLDSLLDRYGAPDDGPDTV
jgi:hypothetical protein